MADERDLELLDDYFTNRMSEQDRSAFEQRLKADPNLQHEYALQERLIQGIKDARVAELKSLLNNVPIPAGNPGNALASKFIMGTVGGLIVAAGAYWYFRNDQPSVTDQKAKSQEEAPLANPIDSQVQTDNQTQQPESTEADKQVVETDKNQTSAGTEHSKPSLAKKPDPLSAPGEKDPLKAERDGPVLDVFTPDDESRDKDGRSEKDSSPGITRGSSSLVVETDRNNRTYTFHYQFRNGKLFLYGPFEKNLYEIMEFFTDDKRTVFLFYKDQYYLLPEVNGNIRPLSAISDPALIKKLKEYRNSK